MSGSGQSPSQELISAFTSTPGGVMTDEVGAVTGALELVTRPAGSGIEARVRYAGARDLYTITGSPVRSDTIHQEAHRYILDRLTNPGKVVSGNELPVDLMET